MEKQDIYKLFALGLVAVFVIEMVALGALNTGGSASKAQQDTEGQQSALDLTGNAADNVTILRYEPYLIVTGNASALEEAKQRLVSQGIATYATAMGGSLIVNLNGSGSALAAAAEFEGANATVLANAVIAMSDKVRIAGDGITADAKGSTFKWQIRPIYPAGSKVPATFVARAEGGQITGMGSLVLLPEFVSGAEAEARIESVLGKTSLLEVGWAGRDAAKPLAQAAGAAYKERSFILISQNATQEQLDAAKALPYVTAAQPGLASVQNEFVDEARARQELSLLKLEPAFPPSIAYYPENGSQAANATLLLAEKMGAQNISAAVVDQISLQARLPATVEKGGKAYSTGGKTVALQVSALEENQAGFVLSIDFESIGGVVSRIISARPIKAVLQAAQEIPLGPSNGTGSADLPPAMPSYNSSAQPPNNSLPGEGGPQR